MKYNKTYLIPLLDLLQQNANEHNAFHMKKYMRGQFEYYGIKQKERREICKTFVSENGLPKYADIEEVIKGCWIIPEREIQHFGQELVLKYKDEWKEDIIDLIEWMICHKSWWDTVDYIAIKLAGAYFIKYPGKVREITRAWIDSEVMWLQRAALIFQLKYKTETDIDLLFSYINKHKHQKEFFIKKAIGWALRELSRTIPNQVIDFVEKTDLQTLSKKEALKRINI